MTRRSCSLPVLASLLLASLLAPSPALAGNDLRSIEYDLVLRPDGRATLFQRLAWRSPGGMHGFYLQGIAGTPVFEREHCYADLPAGRRVPLAITPTDARTWDVVLAGGEAFGGEAYYFLKYGLNLAADRYLGTTTSPELGRLVYFDWAVEQWDEPLEHRTVRIVLPLPVPPGAIDPGLPERLGWRTEKEVNKENAIDWLGSPGDDGQHYLTVRFHQDAVATGQPQRLRFYLRLDALPLVAGVLQEAAPGAFGGPAATPFAPAGAPGPTDRRGRPSLVTVVPLLLLAGLLVGVLMLLYWRKAAGFSRSVAQVEKIRWEGDNWIPPRLQVGTYQVPGKIPRTLHPVQAALLLEWPLDQTVTLLLEQLRAQGVVEILASDPLQIRPVPGVRPRVELEEQFLKTFDAEGRPRSERLSDFCELVLQELQEQIWDCDLDATRVYYRQRLEPPEGLSLPEPAEPPEPVDEEDPHRASWSIYHLGRVRTFPYALRLPSEFGSSYTRFMSSASCFKGCFTPASAAVGNAAACYSACHNACHSACHHACHSACHSACVSGRSH